MPTIPEKVKETLSKATKNEDDKGKPTAEEHITKGPQQVAQESESLSLTLVMDK
jgi:hypothetical protein